MSKQKIEIEVDVPEGYEATGEYREPTLGESYLSTVFDGEDCLPTGEKRIILRKKKTWRVPTDEDAKNRPACRCKVDDSDRWLEGATLLAVRDGRNFILWRDTFGVFVRSFCEIED